MNDSMRYFFLILKVVSNTSLYLVCFHYSVHAPSFRTSGSQIFYATHTEFWTVLISFLSFNVYVIKNDTFVVIFDCHIIIHYGEQNYTKQDPYLSIKIFYQLTDSFCFYVCILVKTST